MIQPVQDSAPDGQPMEETTYLEHSALGVSLDSGLMEGMSCTEPLEQSVLGECLVTPPEGTDTPERPALASRTDHEETCLKLSARLMPDTDIVHNADVSIDIYTDLLDNSAPRIISDLSLFKWNTRPYSPVRNTQGGRPMEGMMDSIISGSQDSLQNAEGKQFSCDAGLSRPELEDAI